MAQAGTDTGKDPLAFRGQQEPSCWVRRFIGGVRPAGTIADIACGAGRHIRLGLSRGYRMVGVDRDLSGVSDLQGTDGLELIAADLESGAAFPLANRRFDGVIVTDYLWRPILGDILDCVAPSGLLIYKTFAAAHATLGVRPSRPEFLLKPNELIDLCAPRFTVVAYEQVHITKPRQAMVQRIVAAGPAHAWSITPPNLDQIRDGQ
jgi:SAM-dependent methyltransferase